MASLLQSTALRLPIKVYLSSDHLTDATSKTVAVTISKNGGAFGNPSAGATNATEIASGWYYVDLSTTDTATLGPLLIRATATSCDNSEQYHVVEKATNRGMTALPDTAVTTNASLPTSGTGTDQISLTSGRVDLGKTLGTTSAGTAGYVGLDWGHITAPTTTVALTGTTIATTQKVDVDTIKTQTLTAAAGITFPTSIASPTNITAGTITTATNLTNLPSITAGWLTATGIAADAITAAKIADGAIDTATFASGTTIPRCTLVDTTTTNTDMRGTDSAATAANLAIAKTTIDGIKTKTDNLPSDPADASDIASSFSTVNSTLATIGGYIDTEVAAIKAKTDNLPASPAAVGSAMTLATGAIASATFASGATIPRCTLVDTTTTNSDMRGTDSAALASSLVTAQADLDDIQTRLPAALVSGRIDASVGAMAANTLTASALATDADAEIAAAVWDLATSGHTTSGTFGLAATSSSAPSADTVASAVWDATAASHDTSGSFGAAVNDLGDIADPLANAVPGSYASGTAGNTLGNLLGNLSSRAVTITNPVASDLSVTLVQGDDYTVANGRVLTWRIPNYTGPTYSGLTIQMGITPAADYKLSSSTPAATLTGSCSMSTTTLVVKVPVLAADTAALAGSPPNRNNNYVYQLFALDGAGQYETLALGPLTCQRKSR